MPATPDRHPDDPGLSALADALRALAPRAGGLDRDAVLFSAGQASVPHRGLWPLAAALSAGAALALGAVLLLRPPATRVVEVERIVYRAAEPAPAPEPPQESPPAESPSYPPAARHLQIQDQLLRWGLDGLGEPSPPAEAGPGLDALFNPY